MPISDGPRRACGARPGALCGTRSTAVESGMPLGPPNAQLSRSQCFAALDLDACASPDQIRRAYRRLVLKLHPDRAGNSDASRSAFLQVVEAYRTLKSLGCLAAPEKVVGVPAHQIRYPGGPSRGASQSEVRTLVFCGAGVVFLVIGAFAFLLVRDVIEQAYKQAHRTSYIPQELWSESLWEAIGFAILIATGPAACVIGGYYIFTAIRRSARRKA